MTKTIEERYKKLSQREHVLLRPGTYVGSVNVELKKLFVIENINLLDELKIVNKIVNYNPAYIKIFDEILSNASDHSIRTNKVKYIKVNVFQDSISIENDGPGIPVEIHKEHGIYVPELLFANLLTGENYNDNDNRVVIGTNGLGGKLVSIFSKKFIVETADGKNKYVQVFENNLEIINKPTITPCKSNYTKITYYPDFERFGLTENTDEIQQILLRRTLDISSYCPNLNIYYNDNLLNIKNFKDYMKLHLNDDSEIFYEKLNGDWEVGVSSSFDDNFQQISLVNGNNTYVGGTHVNYITNQIVNKVIETLEKKHKKIKIKPNDVKNKLFIFLNSKVVNPVFDSQTKENLSTRLTQAHVGNIEVSDKFIKQISQSAIVEDILNYIQLRENADLKKLNKGKTSKVKIKKLDDANFAGTSQSEKCILFLAEGDSGAGTIITGFSSTGRDYYGSFPLKGKPLNVLDVSMTKIKENDEIKNIITALGLEFGKKYTSTKDLRYGKVVFASDADCIDENTLIRTERGNIPIKHITYDDKVLTHSGEYKQILNIIQSEKEQYVKFTVNGDTFNFGINHKLLVMRDGNIIEIFAYDLKNTDFLLIKKS